MVTPTEQRDSPGFLSLDFWLAFAAFALTYVVLSLFYRFGDLVHALGGTDRTLGLVVGAGSVSGILARIGLPRGIRVFGLRGAWLASFGMLLIGSSIVALDASLSPLLAAGRVCFAIGASGAMLLPILFVQQSTPPERRAEALSLANSGMFGGMVTGAWLGQALLTQTAFDQALQDPTPFTGSTLGQLVQAALAGHQLRFVLPFVAAAIAALLGGAAVAWLAARGNPLAFEPAPQAPKAAPTTATAGGGAATAKPGKKVDKPSTALLGMAFATNFAFTFLTVYLTRYLAERQLGGFSGFFAVYCSAAFLAGMSTKRWGKMVGAYRMMLIGAACYVFGNLLFLIVNDAWHLAFPATACGVGRALLTPALIALAERSDSRAVGGKATQRLFLAMDFGNLTAALTMGALIADAGFDTTIVVTALVLSLAAAVVARTDAQAGAAKSMRRRRDDFRSRRKADHGAGQWTGVARSMLVYVKTANGARLDGALHQPAPKPPLGIAAASVPTSPGAATPAEAVLMIHADQDDFCSPSVLENVQNHFLDLGLPVLRINTSGKGVINSYGVQEGSVRQGSAFEIVRDCLDDIDLWLTWLERQGFRRVTLVGHRLGGLKALYYAAHGSRAGVVARVIALAPPRLAHSHLRSLQRDGEFDAELARARALLAEGKRDALYECAFPTRDLVSPSTYLDKFGPEATYDVLTFAARIRCPALCLLCPLDERSVLTARGLLRDLRGVDNPRLTVQYVAGANQFYTSVREKAVLAIDEWLRAASVERADAGPSAPRSIDGAA